MRTETVNFVELLHASADPARADYEKRYMKSARTDWGLSIPKIDASIRTLHTLPEPARLAVARDLWREEVYDLRIASARIVTKLSGARDADIWRFLAERMSELDGWAIADNFADSGGPRLVAEPERLDEVELWVASSHLWTRRASLVFTLAWMRSGRSPERMLGWARATRRRPRMVHPEGDRLVAARTRQTRRAAGAGMAGDARRRVEGVCEKGGGEVSFTVESSKGGPMNETEEQALEAYSRGEMTALELRRRFGGATYGDVLRC